ncbi:MAG: phosphoribosylformylglycinamidine synthase [Phycisphaerales bacterium]|nr:phosphoribosylformylglycinamidine synthase [Phycisphaerales bacterium]
MSMGEIVRFEVRAAHDQRDPRGDALARAAGVTHARVAHSAVYLVSGVLDANECNRLARELLADPVTQVWSWTRKHGASSGPASPVESLPDAIVEVHPLPGVMDPAAQSVRAAAKALLGDEIEVRTGARFDFWGVSKAAARQIVEQHAANPVIQAVFDEPHHPHSFPQGSEYTLSIREVQLSLLDGAALDTLSRDAHLFLSRDEMQAIQTEYKRLGRNPREIELETIAQTWSEHCVHKTLKSTIRYSGEKCGAHARPGHELNGDGSVTIRNLLKTTVAAATHELMGTNTLLAGPGVNTALPSIDWCLSVFVDNSGVIAFDDDHAVCFKVETHNHPSAIEPYGGAATGIGGCIRDIIGTGQGAKPIASTDVFCVASGDLKEVPRGCIAPERVLSQVVAGIRDYGNRMGIPTLNGAVWFDDRYVGNPLVYAGCVGIMPRNRTHGTVVDGDVIVAIGGRTGRDGIHGATFSSAELTDTHADEFSHAVQIGNAITEKVALDAILAARDHAHGCLYHGLTDCGAGGFSSAVGEMASSIGADVHLDRAPVKYAGMSPTEIWISEAQERFVLAVPKENIAKLASICELHTVEMCELGTFGTPDQNIILRWHGTEVGRLDTRFLHAGIPSPVREAVWDLAWSRDNARFAGSRALAPSGSDAQSHASISQTLCALLAHPNIASKAWIIRQYDHEVQGTSVVKPLVGIGEGGPSDAAVIAPVAGSTRGLAIANGLATGLASDPYVMGLSAIDECIRNLVCVGADPTRIAILDNFCWPSCRDARNMGALVRAAWACYDAAKAYRTPFISGKDSLNNQFVTDEGKTIQIPPTLLISGFAIVNDINSACTMDFKSAGNAIIMVGTTSSRLGGSHFALLAGSDEQGTCEMPVVDLAIAPRIAAAVARAIAMNCIRSAHDCSEGGVAVALAEMAFAGGIGAEVDLAKLPVAALGSGVIDEPALAFCEDPSRYLLEVKASDVERVCVHFSGAGIHYAVIGTTTATDELRLTKGGQLLAATKLDTLRSAWSTGAA